MADVCKMCGVERFGDREVAEHSCSDKGILLTKLKHGHNTLHRPLNINEIDDFEWLLLRELITENYVQLSRGNGSAANMILLIAGV